MIRPTYNIDHGFLIDYGFLRDPSGYLPAIQTFQDPVRPRAGNS